MAGFTKLFSSLIFSTVWREDLHVKVVWITMLAMANRHGDVLASVPGLADAARVTLEQCRDALTRLAAPDPDSRTKTHEGRRITDVDGGWRLLNYEKYRAIRDADERRLQTREAVRRHRARKQASAVSQRKRSKPRKPGKAQAEAEAEAEAETSKTLSAPDGAASGGLAPNGQGQGASQKATWLTPFGDAWQERYGGAPAYGELGKHLKPLRDAHPVGEVLEHWGRYLEATEAAYVSPARFAQTYGMWGKPPRPSKDHVPDMYLTLEEQAARRAKQAAKAPETQGAAHIADVLPHVVPKP